MTLVDVASSSPLQIGRPAVTVCKYEPVMFVSDDNEPEKFPCLHTFEMDSRRVLLSCSPFYAITGLSVSLENPTAFFSLKLVWYLSATFRNSPRIM